MSYPEIWLGSFTWLVLHYFGFTFGVMAIFYGLQAAGWRRRFDDHWPSLRQHIIEVLISARALAISSVMFCGVIYMIRHGWFPQSTPPDAPSVWLTVLHIVIMVLGHDAYFYWTHRLMHHKWFFSWVHAEHHVSVRPTALTTLRLSVPETVVQSGFFVLWAIIMPNSPIAFYVVQVYIIIISAVGHSGFEAFSRKLAAQPWFLMTTSTHHNMHHLGSYNHNFGIHFRIWDLLMKTENPQYKSRLAADAAADAAEKKPAGKAAPAE